MVLVPQCGVTVAVGVDIGGPGIPEVRLGTLSEKDAGHKIKLLGTTLLCSRQDVAGEEETRDRLAEP